MGNFVKHIVRDTLRLRAGLGARWLFSVPQGKRLTKRLNILVETAYCRMRTTLLELTYQWSKQLHDSHNHEKDGTVLRFSAIQQANQQSLLSALIIIGSAFVLLTPSHTDYRNRTTRGAATVREDAVVVGSYNPDQCASKAAAKVAIGGSRMGAVGAEMLERQDGGMAAKPL
jgi:hypothetical protein